MSCRPQAHPTPPHVYLRPSLSRSFPSSPFPPPVSPYRLSRQGLPLSRLYARYWRGDVTMTSMENWGCDFLLRVPLEARPGERLIIPDEMHDDPLNRGRCHREKVSQARSPGARALFLLSCMHVRLEGDRRARCRSALGAPWPRPLTCLS